MNQSVERSRAGALAPARIILIVGDLLIFIYFAAQGRATHDLPLGSSPLVTILAVAAPFAVPWFILAGLWGAFRLDILARPVRMLLRTAVAWISAGCIGLVARTIILQRPLLPLFAAVALSILGAMLLGWRLVASLVAAYQARPAGRARQGAALD